MAFLDLNEGDIVVALQEIWSYTGKNNAPRGAIGVIQQVSWSFYGVWFDESGRSLSVFIEDSSKYLKIVQKKPFTNFDHWRVDWEKNKEEYKRLYGEIPDAE